MAVRVLTYTIDENSISSSSIAHGGVQGEHNATQIEFVISPLFANKLSNMKKDSLTFCYRFDRYDGVGGMKSTDPIAFVPGKDNKFTHLIENWQTRDGGTIQVYFVITLIDNEATEMELFTYNVKLMLKSKPNAKETDRENYESISTLAMIVKNNTDIVLDATSRAVDACGRTENARMALEGGTEWIFDGGDAEGNIDINFVVDAQMSNSSNNAISNKVVKAYIDNLINNAKLDAHPIGSLYFSSEPTEPSELFGGTWERIKDRFILAAGDEYVAGSDGGEAEVKLKIEHMPRHSHKLVSGNYGVSNGIYGVATNLADNISSEVTMEDVGENLPYNNMPPYEVYFCWKRVL